MASNYLKYFKSEFEKYAQDGPGNLPPSRPSRQGVGVPTVHPAPARRPGGSDNWGPPSRHPIGGGGGVAPSSNTAIMAMQHALQDFAKDVTSQLNLQQIVSGTPEEQKEAKSKDIFGSFMTKNYLRNSDVPGVEYDPDPAVRNVAAKEKSATDPTRMSIVMDTMNRVGKERSESFVDGNWGPRTNAAVRNAYIFGHALFKMTDDINRFVPPAHRIQITKYDQASLKNLEAVAKADNSLTPEQKAEAAPLVTQHVKAIQAAYDELKNKVLQNRTYRQFIEGDKSYKTYRPILTQENLAILKNYFKDGIKINLPGIAGTVATMDDLSSLPNLQAWLQKVAPEAYQSGKATPKMVIDAIRDQYSHLTQTPVRLGF